MCPAAKALIAEARHYRHLAILITDERTRRVLLDMAQEHEGQARDIEAQRDLPNVSTADVSGS